MNTPNTPQTEIQPEEPPDVIVPTDIKTVFQGGQFFDIPGPFSDSEMLVQSARPSPQESHCLVQHSHST